MCPWELVLYFWSATELEQSTQSEGHWHYYKKGLCHYRNMSVLTSCLKCFAWRHVLQAVLLAPTSWSCIEWQDNKESGKLCLYIFPGTLRISFTCPSLTPLPAFSCPSFHQSVLSYIIGVLPPYRAKWENTAILYATQRVTFSCQCPYALIARN